MIVHTPTLYLYTFPVDPGVTAHEEPHALIDGETDSETDD